MMSGSRCVSLYSRRLVERSNKNHCITPGASTEATPSIFKSKGARSVSSRSLPFLGLSRPALAELALMYMGDMIFPARTQAQTAFPSRNTVRISCS